MWEQVRQFHERINEFMIESPEGINLIGYSQGGMIARGVIETSPSHNIKNFISLSSPQAGYHGGKLFVPKSHFSVGNEEKYSVSVSGLWKDPRDIVRYKKEGRFLACLNNDYPHRLNQQFKTTMCRLERLVLIGGPDDGIVVPWQSAHFDFDDSYGNIVEMRNQEFYKNDRFCLRTLDERGAIVKHVVPGVQHGNWYTSPSIIQNYIIPYLT
uniref:palmitoyl-CoA hydrolase n=1 Tax=Strigamia maritima TaxID=126957 RepID=T1IZ79_STRMM